MVVRLFIPAVGYRIRLTHDWSFDLYDERRNDTLALELLSAEAFNRRDRRRWDDPITKAPVSLPAGTVLEVDRVYVRNVNKTKEDGDDFDSVTFKVVSDAGKKVRFWAKLADVNNIEYELPPDHTAGKTAAVERAKRPKKLTPDQIKSIVHRGINAYSDNLKLRNKASSYYGPTPVWMTKDAVAQMKALGAEYTSLYEPFERARHAEGLAKSRADLERRFANGELSLPIAWAHTVKTVDDLKKHWPHYDLDTPFELNSYAHSWERVVTYQVMNGYGRSTFERMSDGTCARTFRPNSPPSSGWNADAPDLSHMWVKVFTDTDDLEVVKVDAGIDTPKGA